MKLSGLSRLLVALIGIQITFVYLLSRRATSGTGPTNPKQAASESAIFGRPVHPPSQAQPQPQPQYPLIKKSSLRNLQEFAAWQAPASIESDNNATVPRVFFAHVGKTGGETIRSTLRIGCKYVGNKQFKQKCWRRLYQSFFGQNDALNQGEPALSRYTYGVMHYRNTKPSLSSVEQATHYLYSLRHPIQRLESWYRYVAPSNCFAVPHKLVAASCKVASMILQDPNGFDARFFQCVPTIHDIPKLLLQQPSSDLSHHQPSQQACRELLQTTLAGHVSSQMAGHMVANLQYYHHVTLGNAPSIAHYGTFIRRNNRGTGHARKAGVLVVRTSALWDDLQAVDRFLGGTGYFADSGLQLSHQSESFSNKGILSPNATLPVCCALHQEMALYKELIERAINLPPAEKLVTLEEALHICQVSSWDALIEACAPTLPKNSLLYRPSFVQ